MALASVTSALAADVVVWPVGCGVVFGAVAGGTSRRTVLPHEARQSVAHNSQLVRAIGERVMGAGVMEGMSGQWD